MEWTDENDLLIADQVLHGTREGLEMDIIWNDLAKKCGCHPIDCLRRWEEELKPQYQMAVQVAEKVHLMKTMIQQPELENESVAEKKKPTKTKKPKAVKGKKKTKKAAPDVDLDVVIAYLRKMKKQTGDTSEVEKLKKEVDELKTKLKEITTNYDELHSDYMQVISILKRAQDMSEAG